MSQTLESTEGSGGLEAQLKRQEELEDNALAQGGERFRRRLEDAARDGKQSTVGAAKKLLVQALDPLTKAIAELIGDTKKRGPKHCATRWCRLLTPEVAAYLTVKTVLDGISREATLRRVALDIMELVLDELRYRRFKEEAPQLFQYKMTKFNTSNYAHMSRSLDAALNWAEVDTTDLEPSVSEKLLVGTKLIDLLMSSTGLITTRSDTHREGRKIVTEIFVVATPETKEWLDTRNAALEYLWPVNLPMVVPPLPWGPGRRGGYRFGLRGKHPMVRGISKAHATKVQEQAAPVVYASMNRIQETPWRINSQILAVVQAIVAQGGGMAGIPGMDDEQMPAKPPDIDTNEASRKEWRKKAHAVNEANHTREIRAKEFSRVLSATLAVKDEGALWFPCNMDFRGRTYPVVNYLHPQGDDLCKSLLTFAVGKALGRDGVGYLALHGANSLGKTPQQGVKISTLTLTERIAWIVDNTRLIQEVAQDPLATQWWADADDPLQFLAFCFEWNNWAVMEGEGRGDDYVCSLPVAMDGSCNGLQHFSAMLRDEIGGEAVNVSPSERPQDIYQRIADSILRRLETVAVDDELARVWLKSGLVDRNLTKRPTMTFGYGSKKFGFRMQLLDYVRSHADWQKLKPLFTAPPEEEGKEEKSTLPGACGFMSALIWDALGEVVVAAQQGMSWMQSAARLVAKNGKCVEWQVPGTGFPVRQEYFKTTSKQIQTVLAGKIIQPRVWEESAIPDPNKQSNAVAPNIVHSLDAAALMMTVNMAANSGIECFGMVHDSYATLAADAPTLAGCTRQAFYSLYTGTDIISVLAEQLRTQTADDVEFPTPPSKGSLDLGGVLHSDYFFS